VALVQSDGTCPRPGCSPGCSPGSGGPDFLRYKRMHSTRDAFDVGLKKLADRWGVLHALNCQRSPDPRCWLPRSINICFEPRTRVHSWRLQCKQLGNDSMVFGQCSPPELVSPLRKRHTADTLRPAKWLLSKVLGYVPAYGPSVGKSAAR
jgi:hypothetical protein